MNDYHIPQDGPMDGRWEIIVNYIDWSLIIVLAVCCLGMVLISIGG